MLRNRLSEVREVEDQCEVWVLSTQKSRSWLREAVHPEGMGGNAESRERVKYEMPIKHPSEFIEVAVGYMRPPRKEIQAADINVGVMSV